ncbi:NADPH-dependent F420 reductase [Nocardioides daphniae]|uniref:NADPH-dependent F420 reductase n=1 Tax=Nocardioides daphniae TaxID=402297 RepID=UPI001EE81A6E|nr:NAD(P)-binding domain-containing protein [Nocardioides daphniae]
MSDLTGKTIAVLGGTGPQGRGLARRFATAGLSVVIGSRGAEKAEKVAAELAEATGGAVTGAANADAAAAGDIVLVVVPWDGHKELLTELKPVLGGKIVVDCVNPLGFDKQGPFALQVEEGSATQQAAAILTESTVVGAFHNVSAGCWRTLRSSRSTVTCWCWVTSGRRPTWCRRWRTRCRGCAGSTAVVVAMPTRWRRSRPT